MTASTLIHSSKLFKKRTVEERNFLINYILVMIWSASSRPINSQYNAWYLNRINLAISMAKEINKKSWRKSSKKIELGFSELLKFLEQNDKFRENKKLFEHKIDELSRSYFKIFDYKWSKLARVSNPNLEIFSETRTIFISLGHHIGIGDELIFSYFLEGLRAKFPEAKIELWTHNKNLWDWNNEIDIRYVGDQILAPFDRAREILRKDESALVVFSDFLSEKIYRHLECVPGFKRFLYIDIGSRIVRSIDQIRSTIFEYTCEKRSFTIYEALRDMASVLGIEVNPRKPIIRPEFSAAGSKALRIFVNPHSSKEQQSVSAEWWADALEVVEHENIQISICGGLSEVDREFSLSVHRLLEDKGFSSIVLPMLTVSEVLGEISRNDVLFGLDTFTAHVNVLYAMKCVTIFFGSSGEAWSVPSSSVLNARVTDEADFAGDLLNLLVSRSRKIGHVSNFSRISAATSKLEKELTGDAKYEVLIAELNAIVRNSKKINAKNARFSKIFFDYEIESLSNLIDLIEKNIDVHGSAPNSGLTYIIEEELKIWKNSNFCRYCEFSSE